MAKIDPSRSMLLLIDLQVRLVPAMADPSGMLANCRRLLDAADIFGIPAVATEQNPAKLGGTDPHVEAGDHLVLPKMSFSATDADGFDAARAGRGDVVVAGCEAHVCVLQSAIALQDAGCRVFVVQDAVSSRKPDSKEAAVRRMSQLGIEMVTTEMVVFEWLGTSAHPRFKDAVALIK